MKPTRIVTHNGSFHTDELFAVAILLLAIDGEVEIIRTRDEEVFATAHYVIDVGGEYDVVKKRFDHHQQGGAGKRTNGIPYASCGLLWKEYGEKLAGSSEVANMIDEDFIQIIDAEDNGLPSFAPISDEIHPVTLARIIQSFNPTWKEDQSRADECFQRLLPIAKEIILRQVKRVTDKKEAEDIVREAYLFSPDKRIILLEDEYPANDVLATYPEPMFLVRYRKVDGKWGVSTIRDDIYS